MVCLSVAVPMLDKAEGMGLPVVESEHNASTCVQGHDHTVCTQYGASRHAPSQPPRHGGISHEAFALTPASDEVTTSFDPRISHDSRAPPLG
jgi:hypothetical protein